MVFCDISKAFDRVWHIGLLKIIESIGISWINNYLSNRKQRVVLNHSNSQWRDIKAWVPPGFNTESSLIYNSYKRTFEFILDRKILKIYFTFVRSLLEYADVIWDNMSMSLNIEKVKMFS